MTQPCPGWPDTKAPEPWPEMSLALGKLVYRPSQPSLNPPAHQGGYCCWACDHNWDDADCTCLEPPEEGKMVP